MLANLRYLGRLVTGSLVLAGLVLWFVLPHRTEQPGLLWSAVMIGIVAYTVVLIHTQGFRTAAIDPCTNAKTAAQQARESFDARALLRMGFAEMPAVAGLFIAFQADEGGYVLYLFGAAASLVLLAFYGRPTAATVARTQRSLEREGGRVDLTAALAADPPRRSPAPARAPRRLPGR